MPETVFRVDQSKSMREQEVPGHNRWHPDIPAASSVRPGDVFRIECKDWTDGQVRNDDSANDIRDMVLDHNHMLSGPIEIEGAEPGDLLVVDYLDLGPAHGGAPAVGPEAGQGWGYTGIFAKSNGGGFLTDHFPDPGKAIWDFQGKYAISRHLPGVRIASNVHAGLAGCAPSAELLAEWNRREQALIDTDPQRVPPLALPPLPEHALLGTLAGSDLERAAREAARTVPPREHGGNVDIKNLSIGSRVLYPVYVPGAKFSIGDLHFAQGDGEISFCGAVEMGGYVDVHVDLIKDGVAKYKATMPIFQPGRHEPRYDDFVSFIGISVDEAGDQHYMNATIAYRRACLQAIDYLTQFGYTGEQAYLILCAAPIEGRVSGIVDIPNACCSLYVPTGIFDVDIRPGHDGPARVDRGQCATAS
ncbi:formamidase [Actinomycetospora sp. CA-084318]|uniref:formamidase n=1 Tax=Actinomycetospora sp. CA-084318 TaxID=3239892 RepID=UPI003D958C1D